MAPPVAVTTGRQTFTFADLPRTMTVSGIGSFDPAGSPITSYQWSRIGTPEGSAAALADDTAVTTTFVADLPGTYLFQLIVVSSNGTSDGGALTAPASSFAAVAVTTEHRALTAPADGERDWGVSNREAIAVLDRLAGDFDTHDADNTRHWGRASDVAFGVVALTEPPDTPGIPIAVSDSDSRFQALVGGGSADGLHSHAGSHGRHHDLRPDLLVGASDLTWTDGQVAAVDRSDNVSGARPVYIQRDAAGQLQIDVARDESLAIGGGFWASPAGDFQAIIDIRMTFDGLFLAQDVDQHLQVGFGWQATRDLAVPDRLIAAGVALSGWGFRAVDLGVSDPTDTGALVDWNADAPAMAPVVRTGLLATEIVVRLTRSGTTAWAEVGVGGGGYVRVGSWSSVSVLAGSFCLFGALRRSDAGVRIKSTGFRISTPDTWFGA